MATDGRLGRPGLGHTAYSRMALGPTPNRSTHFTLRSAARKRISVVHSRIPQNGPQPRGLAPTGRPAKRCRRSRGWEAFNLKGMPA